MVRCDIDKAPEKELKIGIKVYWKLPFPEPTEMIVASCAPLKATLLKSLSGSIPSLSKKLLGQRCPLVELTDPKLTSLPFKSDNDFMDGSEEIKTDLKPWSSIL